MKIKLWCYTCVIFKVRTVEYKRENFIHLNNINVATTYNTHERLFFYVVPIAIQALVQKLHKAGRPLVVEVGRQSN
jgi:hypothetical protein